MSLGVNFLSLIAGLKGCDKSLYEAAAVDGIKNRWQELWYVTLPQLKPHVPEQIDTFVDSFCGGCNVGTNIKADKYIYNDISSDLIELYKKQIDALDMEISIKKAKLNKA